MIGRDRDVPALEQLGLVEVVAQGPRIRRDRTYSLFRVMYRPTEARSAESVRLQGTY